MKLKIKDKEELKVIAKSIFDRYKGAKNVAVTSDGTAFITDENDLAVKNHSNKNRYGKKLAITEFTRDDFTEPKTIVKVKSDKSDKKTIKKDGGNTGKDTGGQKSDVDLIAEIEAATSVDAVIAIVEAEKTGEKRESVLKAAEAKFESLKTAE